MEHSPVTSEPPQVHEFQLIGGHPCLDFANTLDNRGSDRETNLLSRYEDLLAFAEQAKIISGAEAQRLTRAAAHSPKEAEKSLQQALAVREALFVIFSAVAGGKQAPASAVEELNQELLEAGAHRILVAESAGFNWIWSAGGNDFEQVLWRIVQQAGELLTSADVAHVRQCSSESCDWLFLDKSKSHSRRWCDMKVCGNRYKAKRFYQKQRSQ